MIKYIHSKKSSYSEVYYSIFVAFKTLLEFVLYLRDQLDKHFSLKKNSQSFSKISWIVIYHETRNKSACLTDDSIVL